MNTIFAVASLCILPLALTCAVLFYEKSRRALRQKLALAERELSWAQAQLRELRQEQHEARRFESAFSAADVSRRLRDAHKERHIPAQPPERYRYASSLIACGVEAGQLAEGLSFSRQEAEQLVALAGLAQKRGENSLKEAAGTPIYH